MASLKNAMLYNPLVKTIGKIDNDNNKYFTNHKVKNDVKQSESKPLTIDKLVDFVKKLYIPTIDNDINNDKNIIEVDSESKSSLTTSSSNHKENKDKEEKKELVLLNKGDIEFLVNDYLGDNISNLFNDFKISRYGVLNLKTIKISFISAVLTCIKPGFLLLSDKEQINYITCIKNLLLTKYQGNAFKFYRNLDWNKKKLLIDIDNLETSEELIRIISDLFLINIFIIDVEEDSIDVYGGDQFIPFKKNIFLLRHDRNTFESLFFKIKTVDNGCLADDHDIIRSLIESNDFVNFNPVDLCDPTKIYKLDPLFNENLDKYSPEIQIKLEKKDRDLDRIISNQLNNLNKVSETSSEKSKEKEISSKMKLEELIEIAMKYKIDLKYKDDKGKEKKKTKQMLYEEIIEYK